MTLGDVANKARALTHTDTQSYTAANLLIDINIWCQKAVSMILESMDETNFDDNRQTNYPIQTTPMIAGQRDYPLTVGQKVLKIKRLDLTYNGVDYFKAEPFDDGEFPWGFGNDTQIDQNFIQAAPRYSVKYNSVWIYPMPLTADVSAGGLLRMEWDRQIIPFTSADYTTDPNDSTVVLGFDDPFHPIVAYGAAYEKANSDNLPQLANIKQDLADWEARMRIAYSRKQLDRRLQVTPAYTYNSFS